LGESGNSHEIEPLEPDLWFGAIERLSRKLPADNGGELENMLRHGFHLVQLTPGPLKGTVRCEIGEEAFEELLDLGAFDTAALALLGSPMCFELVCSLDRGRRVVTGKAWLPGQDGRPTVASGDSLAAALVHAWAKCLIALRQRSLQEADPAPRRYPHRAPLAQHQKLSEH
jgi:hypothetical protein